MSTFWHTQSRALIRLIEGERQDVRTARCFFFFIIKTLRKNIPSSVIFEMVQGWQHSALLQWILIAGLAATVQAESYYSIIAPGTIRSNRRYSVGVSLHDAPSQATIRLTLSSPATALNKSQEVTLQPRTSTIVDFHPGLLKNRFAYELKAEGTGGVTFSETRSLTAIVDGGPRVYIETDRGTYKPGDVVHFNVFIVDEHLKPLRFVEPIRVQVLDAQRNRVKQFKDIELKHGMFANNFTLSQQPLLGKWSIEVFISGKYNKNEAVNFVVEKYVLPKFSVHVEPQIYYPSIEKRVRATVYAKYVYGEYVEGTAVVTLHNPFQRDTDSLPKQTVVIENGAIKAEVAIDTSSFGYVESIIAKVNFTERITGITLSGEAVVTFRFNRYNMTIPESGFTFKDHRLTGLQVMVQNWDGSKIKDLSEPVKLTLNERKYEAHLNAEGLAEFKVDTEPGYRNWITYNGDTMRFDNAYRATFSYDYDMNMCTLQMKGRSSTNAYEPLEIELKSSENIPYMILALTSHGNLLREEFKMLPENTQAHTFKLNISIEMIPKSFLYVHYVFKDKLYYCELTLNLPEKFENEISISAPKRVKPGQNVTFEVKGQPHSQVALVAVDKASLLLNSDNILPKKRVMDDLRFDRAFVDGYDIVIYPGYLSGLIIITNGKYEVKVVPKPREPLPQNNPTTIIRSLFPETWFCENFELENPVKPLEFTVPGTITTWVIRAFSVNDLTGFAMLDQSLDLVSFQPFFVSTNLPYAVKRGEVVTITASIFNYLGENQQTEIILENAKQEYVLLDERNQILGQSQHSLNANIPADSGKSVAFFIRPRKLGDLELKITARNAKISDTIIQKLKVEPDGIKQQVNQEASVALTQGKTKSKTFHASIPSDIIAESEYLVLSVSGDIMVSALEHLDQLVQQPSGCGEQNMINLAPNILVLEYLKAMQKYTSMQQLVARAKGHIDRGYQQELTYRHPEGGYSVFGPTSTSKQSNWLTAYVTRFFMKALPYSAIEPRIIESGLEYLAKQQLENGSFPQSGYLFEPAHQNEFGFTAFVVMTFLENNKYSKKYTATIEKALRFLNTHLDDIDDTYALAIIANVLLKTGNTRASEIIEKLKLRAQEDNGLMWWTSNRHQNKPKKKKKDTANDVEITSYVLMAMLETPVRYASAFNWLIKQRNSHGGFGSTHDTVVGLQALIKYAETSTQIGAEETQLKVHYVVNDEKRQKILEKILQIDVSNELVLQKQELPPSTRSVEIEVTGQGKAFLQFSYQYYTTNTTSLHRTRGKGIAMTQLDGTRLKPQPSAPTTTKPPTHAQVKEHDYFRIQATAKLSVPTKSMTLGVCCSYNPLEADDEPENTNMVIMEVHLPSGFVANGENMEQLKETEQVSRVELKKSATMMAIYFERLEANEEQCLTVVADRVQEVAELKSAAIEMYDYYDDERHSAILYKVLR